MSKTMLRRTKALSKTKPMPKAEASMSAGKPVRVGLINRG